MNYKIANKTVIQKGVAPENSKWIERHTPRSRNGNLLKKINQFMVLDIVRKYAPLSKEDIVRTSELSRPTVAAVVNNLLKKNFITEVAFGESTGGRRPIIYELNPNGWFIIGVDFNVPDFTVILVDLKCNVIVKNKEQINTKKGKAGVISQLKTSIHKIIQSAGIEREKILGMGLGVPGLVDRDRGISISIERLNVPDWKDVPVVDLLKEEFSVPVLLEDDANLMTMAEMTLGAGQDVDNLAYVVVTSGIGLGIIINGRIYGGNDGNAGILGHTTIDRKGPKCVCGNFGCLEAMAAEPAILKKAKNALSKGRKSLIKELAKQRLNNISLSIIFEAAREKDRFAQDIVDELAALLSIGIANVILLFDPQIIILGGKIISGGDNFLNKMKQSIGHRARKMMVTEVDIRYAKLTEDAVALGAALLILEDTFKTPAIELPYKGGGVNYVSA